MHITLPDYYSPENVGMIVPKTKDGRVVFMLPWLGETIAGTTDAPCEVTMRPKGVRGGHPVHSGRVCRRIPLGEGAAERREERVERDPPAGPRSHPRLETENTSNSAAGPRRLCREETGW